MYNIDNINIDNNSMYNIDFIFSHQKCSVRPNESTAATRWPQATTTRWTTAAAASTTR